MSDEQPRHDRRKRDCAHAATGLPGLCRPNAAFSLLDHEFASEYGEYCTDRIQIYPAETTGKGEGKVKQIKMLGLAALSALMALAFAGTGSASAETTALCTADEEPCQEGNIVTHVHEATLSGVKAKFLSSSLSIECDVLFLGDALAELAEPLVIHGSFTYSNCNNGCTITEENGPAEVRVLKTGHEAASVTFEYLIHLACSFLNCRYNGVGLEWHTLGPLLSTEVNGESSIQEQTTNKESGSFCPTTLKLDIVTTPLSATYISS